MSVLDLTPLVFSVSALAGFLGALTGLGGGVVITPALTLLLGIDIRYAIGASLVSVIATSSGAAAAFVREGYSNIRIGMFLEIATTLGALAGALLATRTPTSALAVIFGVALLHAAWQSHRGAHASQLSESSDPLAVRLKLESSYPTQD
ncbi:MAG: TSUP family transporter, partial [bacterium]